MFNILGAWFLMYLKLILFFMALGLIVGALAGCTSPKRISTCFMCTTEVAPKADEVKSADPAEVQEDAGS